jgi:hypothetical protein
MRFDEILGLLPRLKSGMDDSPGLYMFGLELLFWAAVILLTLALVRLRPVLLERAEARLRQISEFQRFWLVGFGLLVIFVRLALISFIPIPVPLVHDEFSYLLASDTFSHGRLTNPSSPMWQHFESFHINVRPTYQSMYPPAQGMALAIGQTLTGVPWAGVLLTTALMCSAIYWMLLGWLPAPWAFLGGALACVRFGIFSYWIDSYWGGSVAALGGALVLGALPRLRERPTARIGLLLAAGLLILANSRPLEGFLFSLPILISVAVILIRQGKLAWRDTLKAALPAMILLAAGVSWMLYYNWRGTAHPLVMPYNINFTTYHFTKPYFFQKPDPIPVYRHQSMRNFYVFHDLPDVLRTKYALGWLIGQRVYAYYAFFLWPFLLLIGPCIVAIWRSPVRIVLFSVALLVANLFAQVWPPQPHYAAPAAGAVFLAALFSLRHFRNFRSEYTLWGSRAVALAFALWMISPVAEILRDPYIIRPKILGVEESRTLSLAFPRQIERERIQSVLEARGGKHLVIVHYPLTDSPSQDWIYNDADIDHARIIWARDMGYARNKELLDYYPGRQVWYVNHAAFIATLLPYEQAAAPLEFSANGWPSTASVPPISNALQGLAFNDTAAPERTKLRLSAAVSH